MANKKQPRMKVAEQPPLTRIDNFLEVALGYSYEEAKIEALRCIDCKNPRCVQACPVGVKIPEFIKYLLEGALDSAFETIYEDNILPSICGRVCPQESQCEGACIMGIKHEPINIGALERFVGDYGREHNLAQSEINAETGRKVAIVGSGPAGLANAAALRKKGHDVTIFEALHEYGGVLTYGIPEFRLPKSIVKDEIDNLKTMGVKLMKNVIVGKSITIEQLKEEGYEAIFVGSGAGLPSALNIPGENYNGVYFANEFLTRVNLMRSQDFPSSATPIKIGSKVGVVGGGNVAMDAARTAKRIGADEVMIIYRRDMDNLPARREEVAHAMAEGITMNVLHNPVEIYGENYEVTSVKCEKMTLGEKDASGRRRPVPTGEFETFDLDNLIVAIGQKPNPILKSSTPDLKTHDWGGIITDETHQTSMNGVFAGGDAVSGAATVILAMGAGKEAAEHMDHYLKTR